MASSLLAAALDRSRPEEIPYFHLVAEQALPAGVADTILDMMPPIEVFTRGQPPASNLRFALPTRDALADPRIAPAWKEAVAAVNEHPQSLLDWLLTRLRERIIAAYPDIEDRFGPLGELKAVPRGQPNRKRREVGFDAQVVVNSPALRRGTRVRGPHVDAPDKLVSALLYLRASDDDSTGADLELYAPGSTEPLFDSYNNLPVPSAQPARTYPYRHNLLILPINTPQSIHGVSPRGRTAHPRYHIHIVGEMAEPLFAVPMRAPGLRDFVGRLTRRFMHR